MRDTVVHTTLRWKKYKDAVDRGHSVQDKEKMGPAVDERGHSWAAKSGDRRAGIKSQFISLHVKQPQNHLQ